MNTIAFKTNQTREVFSLLKCIFSHFQCLGKSEINLNIRLNDHRKDVCNPSAIPVCILFTNKGCNFVQHAKFVSVEQLTKTGNVSNAVLKFRLKQKENSSTLKVDTLFPKDLCK